MEFQNLRLSEITGVVRYTPKIHRWYSANLTHIIGFKLSGVAPHDFGYKKMSLDEGCVYFLNRSEPYHVDIQTLGESFSVHFTTPEPIDTHSFCMKTENRGQILSCLEKIEALFLKGRHDNEMSMYFYRFCTMLDEIRNKEYTRKNPTIHSCRDYMDLHFREEDCLDNAAMMSDVTRRRFNDIFRNTFDVTPARYITAKKVEYAKSLLITADLSVSDIAILCGFSDVYYFSKVFKNETGSTPTAFRKSADLQLL